MPFHRIGADSQRDSVWIVAGRPDGFLTRNPLQRALFSAPKERLQPCPSNRASPRELSEWRFNLHQVSARYMRGRVWLLRGRFSRGGES